jgi:hypothetical protein
MDGIKSASNAPDLEALGIVRRWPELATEGHAMKSACVGLLLLAAGAAAVSGRDARPVAPPPRPFVPGLPPLGDSAIAELIGAGGGKVPATGADLQAALTKLGGADQLTVPFSAVVLDSGLSHPRLVFTPRLAPLSPGANPLQQPFVFISRGGWSPVRAEGLVRVPTISPVAANRPNLAGRLFLAVNMDAGLTRETARVQSLEFISWNARRKRFDFGVIEGMGGSLAELKFVDGVKCLSCHKTRGPILGAAPWSNTAHNSLVRGALTDKADGLSLITSNAGEVDARVREAADLLRNRELFKMLARTPAGRKVYPILLGGLVAPDSFEEADRRLREKIDLTLVDSFRRLTLEWADAQKAGRSSILSDFSPAGPPPPPRRPGEWGGTQNAVEAYDAKRAGGNPGLPSAHQPSNPKAFMKLAVQSPNKPSQLVNVTKLAETIGLSAGDRAFLARTLAAAGQRTKATDAALTRAVIGGPQFADVVNDGSVPDREEFKERFVSGLDELLRTKYQVAEGSGANRADYANGRGWAPGGGGEEKEPELVPTTACLRCHEVRPAGKARFVEPLPSLAFDPFDKVNREAWLKSADRKRKQEVLARMLKRLAEDKDMPPEDAPEHDRFRVNDPAAFDAVREFLEAELKKTGAGDGRAAAARG